VQELVDPWLGAAAPMLAALARSMAFVATVPLAGSGAVPKTVRAALALILTPLVAARMPESPATGVGNVVLSCAGAAAAGAALGLGASIIASAAAAAGGMIDAAMASQAVGREAVFGGGGGPFGRLYALGFAWAFAASGALTALCARFVDASAAVWWMPSRSDALLAIRPCVEAALVLAAPAIVAQFVATAIAATVARVAPRVNGMMLASPASTALILLVLLAAAPVTLARFSQLAFATGSVRMP